MNGVDVFPVRYRRNIKRLMRMLSTDAETAFSMMVMTAVLTDLNPDDSKVVDYILMDCGVEVEV